MRWVSPTYAPWKATKRNALCSCRPPGGQCRCLQASEGESPIANFITGLDGPFRLAFSGNDLFPRNSEAGTVNEITDMIWGNLAEGHGARILMPKWKSRLILPW